MTPIDDVSVRQLHDLNITADRICDHPALRPAWTDPVVPVGFDRPAAWERADGVIELDFLSEDRCAFASEEIEVSIAWPWIDGFVASAADWRQLGFEFITERHACRQIELSPGMIEAASAVCPILEEGVVRRILSAGLPYSPARVKAACSVVPQMEESVIERMLDAAVAAVD